MIETKSTQHKNEDGSWSEAVAEKTKSGMKWCTNASTYLEANGGKPWRYVLIPHDQVEEANMLSSYIDKFAKS